MLLCSFGCGQPSIKQFKSSGNYCCSATTNSCPTQRKKNSDGVSTFIKTFGHTSERWMNGHPRGYSGKSSPHKGKTFSDIHGVDKAETIISKMKEKRKLQSGMPHTKETKEKLSAVAKIRNLGGYIEGSGRGKKGRYKGIWCDSSWELAWVIYHIDHGIAFRRNTKKFQYIHEDRIKNWIPDFLMEDGSYVEIKGYMTDQAKAKIDSFSLPLKVINKVDIRQYVEYASSTYGRDFIRLYE